MALRIRSRQFAGLKPLATVERASDGLFRDAAAKSWVASPPALAASLYALAPVMDGPWACIYRAAIDTAGWDDGNYIVYVQNAANGAIIDGPLQAVLRNGDDAPAFPPTTVSGTFKIS